MVGYIIRRLIGAAGVLLLLTAVVFLLIRLMPGDALLVKLGQTGRIPEEKMAELRHEMGIDRPLIVQYATWAGGLVRGDLGESLIYEDRGVRGSLLHAIPATAELAVLSILFGLVVGVSIGTLSALNQGGIVDYTARVLAIFGLSAPIFWLSLLVIIYSALWFDYSVTRPYVPIWEDPAQNLRLYAVPSAILGLNLGAVMMRFTRSAMLEVLRQDYIRTASAKGLAQRVVVFRHGLRNALIPIVTLVGTQVAFLLSGSVVLEVIFRMPGLGRLTYEAVLTRDYPVVQGAALFVGTIVVLANLVVDFLYGLLDPRVRYN